MKTIKVELGKRSYPVIVGSGMASRLPARLKKLAGRGRLFVIYDVRVYALYGREMDRALGRLAPVSSFVIPAGEKSKSLSQLSRLRDYLLSEKITRDDLIVAVGGGVISDLAGYAAATTLRGINWVIISTSLLGMVDAAIGGKTGINHSRGKNLVGSFWQPRLVWCDTLYLMTLPERELVSGLGEILKYAGLVGGDMINGLKDYFGAENADNSTTLQKLIESCVDYKAAIVAVDERDTGKRMVLNLGHTFGHAIETGAGYGRFRHGEALILGLKAAVHLSGVHFHGGKSSFAEYNRMVEHCRSLIPHRKINLNLVREALTLDKKRAERGLNFILLQKPGRPIISADVKLKDIKASLRHALSGFELVGKLDG